MDSIMLKGSPSDRLADTAMSAAASHAGISSVKPGNTTRSATPSSFASAADRSSSAPRPGSSSFALCGSCTMARSSMAWFFRPENSAG